MVLKATFSRKIWVHRISIQIIPWNKFFPHLHLFKSPRPSLKTLHIFYLIVPLTIYVTFLKVGTQVWQMPENARNTSHRVGNYRRSPNPLSLVKSNWQFKFNLLYGTSGVTPYMHYYSVLSLPTNTFILIMCFRCGSGWLKGKGFSEECAQPQVVY